MNHPKLKSSLSISLSLQRRIQRLLAWDHANLIRRVSIEHRLSKAESENRVAQYLVFMALNLAFPGEELSPPEVIDTVWHSAILNTRDYREFCGTIMGRFVDHVLLYETTAPLAEIVTAARAIQLAQELFENLDDGIWNPQATQRFVCSNEARPTIAA